MAGCIAERPIKKHNKSLLNHFALWFRRKGRRGPSKKYDTTRHFMDKTCITTSCRQVILGSGLKYLKDKSL